MELIIASVIAFATTNIDDLFLLTLFFSSGKFSSKDVVVGQYLGIGTLIAISFAGSFIGLVIDPRYIGFLGLFPIYIGVKAAISLMKNQRDDDEFEPLEKMGTSKGHVHQLFLIASVTIANGGDNISIYIPLFATLTLAGKLTMTFIFFVMTAIWCMAAQLLGKRPVIQKAVEKYGHIITPFVFILLGIYIMYESKTFNLLLGK